MKDFSETTTNIIAEGTRIEGKIIIENETRCHGTVSGDIHAKPGSVLVLAESAVVEGNIFADSIIIDGYVRGDVSAVKKITISGTGRVVGNVKAPSLQIDFGAYFEGKASMEDRPFST